MPYRRSFAPRFATPRPLDRQTLASNLMLLTLTSTRSSTWSSRGLFTRPPRARATQASTCPRSGGRHQGPAIAQAWPWPSGLNPSAPTPILGRGVWRLADTSENSRRWCSVPAARRRGVDSVIAAGGIRRWSSAWRRRRARSRGRSGRTRFHVRGGVHDPSRRQGRGHQGQGPRHCSHRS